MQRNPMFYQLENAVADTSARHVLDKIEEHCKHNKPVLDRNSNLHDAGVCWAYDEVLTLIAHLTKRQSE